MTNRYKKYMEELLKEQNDIIVNICIITEKIDKAKTKHERDYYKRELEYLYDELFYSCVDIQNMFNGLD